MKTMRFAATVLGVGALVLGATSTALATKPDVHKVTICHATSSESHPYVQETVDIGSSGLLQGGHNRHGNDGVWYPGAKGDGFNWGDIIPAYFYAPTSFDYPGLNLTTDGQAFLDNNCLAPDENPVPESAVSTVVHAGAADDGSPVVVDDQSVIDLSKSTVHDSAQVSWSAELDAPKGSWVTFYYYKNGTCDGDPADTSDSFKVEGSSVVGIDPGLVETPAEAGMHSFLAIFTSGDEDVLQGSQGACEPFMVFDDTGKPATDVPSEPNTATIGTNGTSSPSNGSWLLVAAVGALLASVVVMTPARAKNRR